MRTYFTLLAFLILFFGASHATEIYKPHLFFNDVCETTLASFIKSHVSSGELESVTFTNTSEGYFRSEWYVDGILTSSTTNFTHSFPTAGTHVIKLKVFSAGDVCSSESVVNHIVNVGVHFCGDLVLPDQSPAECECMLEVADTQVEGQPIILSTNYKWRDRFGNKYCNIAVTGSCEDNIPNAAPPIPTPPPASCQAGYFNLYYNDPTNSITTAHRNIICQVFADISVLISPANLSTFVNFEINAQNSVGSTNLASATSYYSIPSPGLMNSIVPSEVWNAINSGTNNPAQYDGFVNINMAQNFYTGYSNITSLGTPGQYDLYAIMTHELMHALGFASLISSTGNSNTFPSNNLYGLFDQYLRYNNTPILTNTGGNYQYNPASNLTQGCTLTRFDNSYGQSSPIYAPTSFNSSSSLSHFQDQCTNAPGQLYNMHPTIAVNQQRRLLQEEVNVLCKIGYSLTNFYGTPNLLIGGINPNVTTYSPCGVSPLAAISDYYTSQYVYYPSSCSVENPLGFYNINLIGNDIGAIGATIVDLQDLTTSLFITPTTNGFVFSPTSAGMYYFKYRLFKNGIYSNFAFVKIYVTSCNNEPCLYNDPATSCELICNGEFQHASLPSWFTNIININGWFKLTNNLTNGDVRIDNSFPSPSNLGGKYMDLPMSYNSTNIGAAPQKVVGTSISIAASNKYIVSAYYQTSQVGFATTPGGPINIIPNQPFNLDFRVGNYANYPIPMFPSNYAPLFSAQQIHLQPVPALPLVPNVYNSPWVQTVASFTASTSADMFYFFATPTTVGYMNHYVDKIKIIEDNFSAGSDQTILCGQSATLESQFCEEIENLKIEWFETDGNGNIIGSPLGANGIATVTPNHTTIYALVRSISNIGQVGNNGSLVNNATSLDTTDFLTIYVNLPSGGADFIDSIICSSVDFFPVNQTGTHVWNFGDGSTSSLINSSHVYSNSGTYSVIHIVTEFGCSMTDTLTVVVSSDTIQSIFDSISPICQNATIFLLDTISLNGITGTWSPALNNTATTTYIFTPNAGQCALNDTMTIVVNPLISPTFTQVGPYCNGATIPLLPTTSLEGISGTWSPALNNTATTSYIFTPDSSLCALNDTMTIVVNPLITPTFTQVGPYCKNDFYSIPPLPNTSLNGITGTWSPPTIVDAPSTTYTFTPNPGICGDTATLTIVITPAINPTFNIVTDYCMGDFVPPLPTTSLNGISGTWSPPLSQTVSQLYTFTPTPGPCTQPTWVYIWVYDTLPALPPVPADTFCKNTIITMATDSLYWMAGTWSPAFSSNTVGTTIYTFTPNQPCMNPTSWSVTIINCGNCDNLPTPQLSGTITGILPPGSYHVVGDLTVSGATTLENCILAINPNVKINVPPSPDLFQVKGCHLYACHTLWDGIDVANYGKLAIIPSNQNSTLIEDAKIGVNVQSFAGYTTVNSIRIVSTTFNKNKIGIQLNGYPFANASNVFSLYGNVFTKRTVSTAPNSWYHTTVLAGPNPTATNFNYDNPRINPSLYSEVSNLLPTLNPSGSVTFNNGNFSTGILLRNVGIGTSGLAIGKTTDAHPFVFDRMLVGIDAYSSAVDVQHAYFQAPSGNSNMSIGIRTNSLSATAAYTGRMFVNGGLNNPVQFYNLYRAVDVLNYTQLTVQNTRIRTYRSASTVNIGNVGVRYESKLSNNVTVKSNTIHNVTVGIDAYLGCPSGTTVPISLDISGNSIQGLLPSPANGMMVQQAIRTQNNPASMGGTFSTTLFNVNGNSLSNINRGILISSLTVPKMKINDNAIVLNESFGLANSNVPNYFGIQLQTVSSPTVGGVVPTIQGNNISSSTTNAFTPSYQTNLQTRAIMLNSTNNFLISCNVLQKTGVGLYFNNTTGNTIRQNNMSGHRFGLWLESATLGQQGTALSPTENVWTTGAGAWTTYGATIGVSNGSQRIKTYTSGVTNANNSKMYVRNSVIHNPNFIGSASWAYFTPSIPYNSINSVATITNNPIFIACAPPSSIAPPSDSLQIAMTEENYKLAMEQSASEIDSAALVEAMELIKEMNLYEQLDEKPELRDSSTVLDEFYEQRTEENIGFLLEMDKALAEKELATAESYRDQIVDENQLELAVKTVLNSLLNFEKGTFTSNDLDELYYYANTCSYLYGKATNMARIAYNCIQHESRVFEEACPANFQKNMQETLTVPSSETLKLVLFPNPTNGLLFIQSNFIEVQEANCIINSLDGRKIYQGIIHFSDGLDLEKLSMANGLYVIELNTSNETFYEQFIYLK